MKKIYFSILIIFLSSLNINHVSSAFIGTKNHIEKNHIKSSNLVKKYIENLKKELTELIEKYNLEDSKILKKRILKLNNMLYLIDLIKK
jgi:protein-arginine kinase activator protein McsA